jgi:hypothetical protein
MADYYTLIKKTVARLDPSAPGESRRAIYERARKAQLAQLRTISPPLTEVEITGEQLSLEEAVRKVEAEFLRPADDVRLPALTDLVTAADEIGKPIVRAQDRSLVALTKTLANPFSPVSTIEIPLPMIVSGGATGRLTSYWRWRGQPQTAASKSVSGR